MRNAPTDYHPKLITISLISPLQPRVHLHHGNGHFLAITGGRNDAENAPPGQYPLAKRTPQVPLAALVTLFISSMRNAPANLVISTDVSLLLFGSLAASCSDLALLLSLCSHLFC